MARAGALIRGRGAAGLGEEALEVRAVVADCVAELEKTRAAAAESPLLKGAGAQAGKTDPWDRSVWIDDRFLQTLTCAQLRSLLRILIHESIHRTRPRWEGVWNNYLAPWRRRAYEDRIDDEAKWRRALIERMWDICRVCPVFPEQP